jgi:hypothetical protein
VRGWTAVEGRSKRKFADVKEAFKVLIAAGIEENMLYNRQPLGMSETEKLVGKKVFKELLTDKGLVIKPQGEPVLAPKVNNGNYDRESAFNDFGGL